MYTNVICPECNTHLNIKFSKKDFGKRKDYICANCNEAFYFDIPENSSSDDNELIELIFIIAITLLMLYGLYHVGVAWFSNSSPETSSALDIKVKNDLENQLKQNEKDMANTFRQTDTLYKNTVPTSPNTYNRSNNANNNDGLTRWLINKVCDIRVVNAPSCDSVQGCKCLHYSWLGLGVCDSCQCSDC